MCITKILPGVGSGAKSGIDVVEFKLIQHYPHSIATVSFHWQGRDCVLRVTILPPAREEWRR